MGFYINDKITVELTYQEVCAITAAVGEYTRLYSEDADPSVIKDMKSVVNKLGKELFDHPDNNEPNGH